MVRALLVVFSCVLLIHNQKDVLMNAFPLMDCWDSRIDLLLVAYNVNDGFREQMKLFSLIIDLFLGPETIELHRLNVAVAVYIPGTPNGFKYRQLFDYSTYSNGTKLKLFLEHIPFSDAGVGLDTSNATLRSAAFSAFSNTREDAQQVSLLVAERSQVNRLFDDALKYVNSDSKLFFVIVEDSFYDSVITIDQQNYARVENYESLEHAHGIPLGLCGTCFHGWFGFDQHESESLLWTYSCYILMISEYKLAWTDTLKRCDVIQSSLVSIETVDELNFLRPILSNKSQTAWADGTLVELPIEYPIQIGLIRDRDSVSKRFRWVNSAPLTVTHWKDISSPNGGYVQSCGAWLFQNGYFKNGWDDFGCGYRNAHFYLCEANVVTLNPEYFDDYTRKTSSARNVSSTLLLGEIASCPESDTFVSVSGIIGKHDHQDCVLLTQQGVGPLKSYLPSVALFNCEDKQRTFIAYSFVCDHKIHCPNERDEDVCMFRPCNRLSEFTCSSKQCVPIEAMCDLYKDCTDGSDEIDCTDCRFKQCQDGTCIPTHWWDDEETDCIWGIFAGGYTWDIDAFREANTGECAFLCNRTKCVTQSMMNNGVIDCTGPEGPLDETIGALEKSSCQADTPHRMSTTWSPKCVYYRDRYNSLLGCRNMVHLQGCRNFTCPQGYLKCPSSYCIPMHQAHDGRKDCPFGEDEMNEFFPECAANFLCMGSRVCVYIDLICDGYPHCPQGDDELNCKMSCMPGFMCVGGAVIVHDYDLNTPLLSLDFVDPRIRYIDLSGVTILEAFPEIILQLSISSLNVLRVSGCKISSLGNNSLSVMTSRRGPFFGGEWFELSGVHTLDLSHNNIEYISEYSIIKTMYNLRVLNLSHNKLTNINIKAFELFGFPSSVQTLHLSYTEISTTLKLFDPLVNLTFLNLSFTPLSDLKPGTFSSQGIVKLQVLDLRSTVISDFYPDTFKGVSISSRLYTDTYRLCCPQVRGPGIDSHVCHAPADPLSTCLDLMGEEFKRVLLWLAGLLAIFGNLIVVVYRIHSTQSLLKKAYGMFVVHLAVSDFIMGVYLLIIASADVYYRNVYIWNEKQWRNNTVCQIAGFASMLSCEVSTCFVFLITVDRFLALKYPFSQVRFSRTTTLVVCSLVWLLGCAVAVVPISSKYKHWTVYSSNGMCLGLPLTSQRLPGWQFSTAIFIGFNFFMFFLIVVGQITIYRTMVAANHTQRDMCGISYTRQRQDFAVARQLFLVAMSNFMCWFPIGVMGLVSLRGYEIGLAAYAWTAVLILPINSALNPVLYTIPAVLNKLAQLRNGDSSTIRRSRGQQLCSKCQVSLSPNTPV